MPPPFSPPGRRRAHHAAICFALPATSPHAPLRLPFGCRLPPSATVELQCQAATAPPRPRATLPPSGPRTTEVVTGRATLLTVLDESAPRRRIRFPSYAWSHVATGADTHTCLCLGVAGSQPPCEPVDVAAGRCVHCADGPWPENRPMRP
jgi:hypothetical protein